MCSNSIRRIVVRALLVAAVGTFPACGGDDDDSATDGGNDIDGGPGIDAGDTGDGGPTTDGLEVMSITEIIPAAASRQVTTQLTVLGFNIEDGASLVLDNCDTATSYDLSSSVTVAADGRSLTATLEADASREQGIYTVTVTNPDDANDRLECAFRILAAQPPTVTNVVPPTAYGGVAGDGVNSDQVITVTGTNFKETPNVRFVKTDATRTYDALHVAWVSSTSLTAVAPSETLNMQEGDYHVYVINPDLLSGQWLVDTTPGIFTVTSTPPPNIVDVAPARITTSGCTSDAMDISGSGFADADSPDWDADAEVWWVAPAGTSCAGSTTDPNGNVLCPMSIAQVVDSTLIDAATFVECPGQGAWPIMVRNPDGQYDIFFSVEVRSSADGHLTSPDFQVVPDSPLRQARYKHGAEYGFDAFGNAYIYVAGGQGDAPGGATGPYDVLGTTEFSQLDVFGNPGPFHTSMQYQSPSVPRAENLLLTPRQGAPMVRIGKELFLIGGADAATDELDGSDQLINVPALDTTEHARILSYEEMPAVALPNVLPGDGLPTGIWYYQVSAIGPWGESLGSREIVVSNAGGRIELCWNPPNTAGATGYNIYRSLGADGRAQTTAAIAYNVAGDCFTDDGVEELTPAPGNMRGVPASGGAYAAGSYAYRVSATIPIGSNAWETYASYAVSVEISADDVTAGDQAIQLTWDAIPDATYSVFRWNEGAGEYQLMEENGQDMTQPTFLDDGVAFAAPVVVPREEVRPLPPGSISKWRDNVPTMLSPREGHDAVVIHMEAAAPDDIAARILVAGGRTANALGAYLPTAESLGIKANGAFDTAWYDETPQFNVERAFYSLLITQNRNETPVPPDPEDPPCGDLDGDGYTDCDCGGDDCDDSNPDIHPGAEEICGNGIDEDCDLGCDGNDLPCECLTDVDEDGHISEVECGGGDCCDDGSETDVLGCDPTTAPGINPAATEICGNGIDEDCDGVDPPCACVDDIDNDGHISLACGGDDCCDTGADTSMGCTDVTAPDINPDMPEICGNGIDDNCDGAEALCKAKSPVGRTTSGAADAEALAAQYGHAACFADTAAVGPEPKVVRALAGDEPVYVLAVLGDNDCPNAACTSTNNPISKSSEQLFEACLVDDATGHLVSDCGVTGNDGLWVEQDEEPSGSEFGIDALLYFDYMYEFGGMTSESLDPLNRNLSSSAFYRGALPAGAVVDTQVIVGGQSANVGVDCPRAYYRSLRLLSNLYLIGGWINAQSHPQCNATGPTDTIERHIQ